MTRQKSAAFSAWKLHFGPNTKWWSQNWACTWNITTPKKVMILSFKCFHSTISARAHFWLHSMDSMPYLKVWFNAGIIQSSNPTEIKSFGDNSLAGFPPTYHQTTVLVFWVMCSCSPRVSQPPSSQKRGGRKNVLGRESTAPTNVASWMIKVGQLENHIFSTPVAKGIWQPRSYRICLPVILFEFMIRLL